MESNDDITLQLDSTLEQELSDRTSKFYDFLEEYKDFLVNHEDLPKMASKYNDWKGYKEATVKFTGRVDDVFHQVLSHTNHLQVENVDEEDADSRLLLEVFLEGVADLISFLVKATLLPFDVKAPLSRDRRKFRDEVIRLIREM